MYYVESEVASVGYNILKILITRSALKRVSYIELDRKKISKSSQVL